MSAPRDPIKYAAWLEKQRASHTGKHPNQSTLDKMSESHKGLTSWNKGIPSSDSTKQKQSDALKNKPKPPFSKEHCENISKSKMGKKNPMYGKHIDHISEDMKCPLCQSRDVKKNGTRKLVDGTIVELAQCNKCGYRTKAKRFK
jgi:hypothetical protein